MVRTTLCALSCLVLMLGCTPEVLESASESEESGEESSTTQGDGDEASGASASGDGDGDGDGDADASGDGDGDASGDGDGDASGDGDGDDASGDGDGDASGDGDGDDASGDGDGDPSGDGDGDASGDGDGDEELALPWIDCAEEANLVSENSDQGVTITWINVSGETRKTFWLNYQGQRVPYSNLGPDDEAAQGTFEGHPWLITDADDNCIVIYLPGPQDADAYLD